MRNKINSILKLLNSDDNSLIFNANSPDTIYCSLMAPYLHFSLRFLMECRHWVSSQCSNDEFEVFASCLQSIREVCSRKHDPRTSHYARSCRLRKTDSFTLQLAYLTKLLLFVRQQNLQKANVFVHLQHITKIFLFLHGIQ